MRRLFGKLHLWLSVPFGIVITITCFTGALLVFEEEITASLGNDMATVIPAGQALPLNLLVGRVDATFPADVDVKGVVVSASPDKAYKVNLSKPKKAAVYVNQYTGEVIGKDERLPFFKTVFRLHRWLMDSNPGDGKLFWGKMIVGASTLACVVILITGLVIWWPRNRKMLRNRLQIAVRNGKSRFWYDLHVAGGFYAFLLLLSMALTGLNWSFEWYRSGVNSLLGTGKYIAKVENEGISKALDVSLVCQGDGSASALPSCVHCSGNDFVIADTAERSTTAKWNVDAVTAATNVADTRYVDAGTAVSISEVDAVTAAIPQNTEFDTWQKAFENILELIPDFETITVSNGIVSVKDSRYGNIRAADKYLYNVNTGEIEGVELYKDSNREGKISGWFYSVHTGSWGGCFSKLCSFLAALLGATLPLTGYYFWIKRLYGKRKSKR